MDGVQNSKMVKKLACDRHTKIPFLEEGSTFNKKFDLEDSNRT